MEEEEEEEKEEEEDEKEVKRISFAGQTFHRAIL